MAENPYLGTKDYEDSLCAEAWDEGHEAAVKDNKHSLTAAHMAGYEKGLDAGRAEMLERLKGWIMGPEAK